MLELMNLTQQLSFSLLAFIFFSVSTNTLILTGTSPHTSRSGFSFSSETSAFANDFTVATIQIFHRSMEISGHLPPFCFNFSAASLRLSFQCFKSSLNNSHTQLMHPLMQQLSGSGWLVGHCNTGNHLRFSHTNSTRRLRRFPFYSSSKNLGYSLLWRF